MNPYGDPQSARAQARVPGTFAGSAPDDEHPDSSRPAPDAYRRPAGRATVSGAVPHGAAGETSGRVVGGASGRVPVGAGAVAGRASVGSARAGARPAEPGYGTRGAVARAAVRPAGYDVGGGSGPIQPSGAGARGKKDRDPSKVAKRRRRANILTAAAAVVVILLGAGVVAGTWYFDDVALTEPKAEVQVTQLMASDGKTQLASIGEQNRSIVPYQKINPVIGYAVMGAEDKNFLHHHGIDMKGIMRAAWNNFTGGDTQGASTITQQYARHAADLKEISYNRKLREAVLARKMEEKYSKQEILGRYLNSVYFGRGAYGIEAAVKAYFGNDRSSLTPPGKPGAITAGEAAILASVIKQPEPVPGGHQGYDPQNNLSGAQQRWNYTLDNMVEQGWLTAQNRPTAYPKYKPFDPDACSATCGNDKPTGKIIKYVKRELLAMGIKQDEWAQGGLRITTTINEDVQKAAEKAVNRRDNNSPMHALKSSYKPALVAVNPTNGRVLAYYGGPKGDAVGWDYAGPNYDNKTGNYLGGGRPPGSSFKIYTLLAALTAGYGFDTTWDGTLKKIGGDTINNSSRTRLACDKRRCPLETATIESYNFPFYWLAEKLTPPKVIDAAHDAGVQYIASPKKVGQRIDLAKTDNSGLGVFGNEVGFGQYAITPLDHANGIATLANDGVYNKAHFVIKVEKRDPKTGTFKPYHNEQTKGRQAFSRDVVAAIDNVLQKIPAHNGEALQNGRHAIAKTGTWEYKDGKTGENGDAWTIGATRQIAASVWVGNYDKNNNPLPIKTADGRNMSGGTVPAAVWKRFMDLASAAINAPNEDFLPNVRVGDPNMKGNGLAPLPTEQPQQDCILGGLICPGNNGGNGNGNGGNGNGNGNGGNGNGNGGKPGPTVFPTLPRDNQGNDTGGGGGVFPPSTG